LDLGPLALVALVPLLWAWRGTGPGWAALYGGIAGLVFFAVLVSWTRFFGFVAYVPFAVFLASWWALGGAVIGWLGRRGAAPAPVVAAVWVLVEAGRGRWPFGGVSWGEVGYAFHDLALARSLAAWGGHLLVSLAAVTLSGLALDAVLAGRARGTRRTRDLTRAALAVAGVTVAVLAAPVFLPELTPTGTLRVALVQGNDKNRELTGEEVVQRYLPRNHFRLAGGISRPVDLIVFPESSLDADPRLDPFLDQALTGVAREHEARVLAGGNTDAPGGRLYNTAFLYTPEGRSPEVYRKQHLVPFGEFVPWRKSLSFISALEAVPRDFAPGGSPTAFPVGRHRIGALICFDSAFASLARDYARAGADGIVVMTNNRSYRRSANSAQHLAMGQFRAAETGRPVLQAAISGISAVIDGSGRVRDSTQLFAATVLGGEVRTTAGRTPYVAFGDWVLVLAVVLLVSALLRLARKRAAGGS
jgi:apolipoprotein N-acyltransferase